MHIESSMGICIVCSQQIYKVTRAGKCVCGVFILRCHHIPMHISVEFCITALEVSFLLCCFVVLSAKISATGNISRQSFYAFGVIFAACSLLRSVYKKTEADEDSEENKRV